MIYLIINKGCKILAMENCKRNTRRHIAAPLPLEVCHLLFCFMFWITVVKWSLILIQYSTFIYVFWSIFMTRYRIQYLMNCELTFGYFVKAAKMYSFACIGPVFLHFYCRVSFHHFNDTVVINYLSMYMMIYLWL